MKRKAAARRRRVRKAAVLCLLAAVLSVCLLGGCGGADTGTETDPLAASVTDGSGSGNTESDTEPAAERDTDIGVSASDADETEGGNTESGIGLDAVTDVTLPADSSEFSPTLAGQLLGLCTGNTVEGSTARFEKAGFTAVLHENYDKADSDPSHTCAYSVGRKTVTRDGRERTVLLVAVRGTNAGEWYSNVDVVPSRSGDTAFAENFYLAAQNVYEGIRPLLTDADDPVILVCGHSRGAACANLLGVLLDAERGTDDVFVYTFASPNTVRKTPDVDCSNIFNIINPCDPVTSVPPASLGFFRAGRDITLPGSTETIALLKKLTDTIDALVPTVTSYYGDRHSLSGPGLSEDGLSAYDLARTLADLFVQATAGGGSGSGSGANLSGLLSVSEDSDLYPFVQTVTSLYKSGDLIKLLRHHMPGVYLSLMTSADLTAQTQAEGGA